MPKVISNQQPTVNSQQTAIKKLWCLLIGVGEYQDKNLRSLSYALADCQGLAKALKQANHNFISSQKAMARMSKRDVKLCTNRAVS